MVHARLHFVVVSRWMIEGKNGITSGRAMLAYQYFNANCEELTTGFEVNLITAFDFTNPKMHVV